MKEKVVRNILDKMRDTDDPIVGAVFEKSVKTSFGKFCVFMLTTYKHLTMETEKGNGASIYLFYNSDDATGHVGTYIPSKKSGYFGGSRVGSKNPMRNPGDPDVKEPFNPGKYNFENHD